MIIYDDDIKSFTSGKFIAEIKMENIKAKI